MPSGRSGAVDRTARPSTAGEDTEGLELRLLLEGVYAISGFDFRDYAANSVRRRVRHFLTEERLPTISALQDRVLHDGAAMMRLIGALSVTVTSMFRDPEFFLAIRTKVVPLLRTYPFIRVWHAGCATGEEVYSMAILLQEEGVYERARIYATDMNESSLAHAEAGVFPLESMQANTANYLKSGGRGPFSRFYNARTGGAAMLASLRRNVVFSRHNLVTDGSFNEFNLVLCRNVLIYFQRTLQDRVHKLLYDSLSRFGVLGLGAKETLQFTPFATRYQDMDARTRLYRKVA
jgi:chemotaxis protein methyltransferase CheR